MHSAVHLHRAEYQNYRMANSAKSDTRAEGGTVCEGERDSDLAGDRHKRLTDIGFVWTIPTTRDIMLAKPAPASVARNSYDDHWEAMFETLKAFQEANGHCLVPKRFKDDPKLGTWGKFDVDFYCSVASSLFSNSNVSYHRCFDLNTLNIQSTLRS